MNTRRTTDNKHSNSLYGKEEAYIHVYGYALALYALTRGRADLILILVLHLAGLVDSAAPLAEMGGACFCNGGHFQEININMEFVTCSQDSVVFWDYKSFSSKRSAQPFSGSGYHVQSACWSASSIQTTVYRVCNNCCRVRLP